MFLDTISFEVLYPVVHPSVFHVCARMPFVLMEKVSLTKNGLRYGYKMVCSRNRYTYTYAHDVHDVTLVRILPTTRAREYFLPGVDGGSATRPAGRLVLPGLILASARDSGAYQRPEKGEIRSLYSLY